MRTVEEIVELYNQRRTAAGPIHNQMRRVRELANGDVIVPLNELDKNAKASVANLLVQGLDQMSMRVSSTMPTPYFPPIKEGSERSKSSARQRKKAMMAMWDENKMQMKLRRRARHLLGYSQSAVVLKPNFRTLTPQWTVRNPLDTFAAPVDDPDNMLPDDCIFTFRASASYLISNYGQEITDKLRMGHVNADSRYTMLEYVDSESLQLIVLGAEDNPRLNISERAGLNSLGLEMVPNRTGMPLAVVANRVTLDKPRGQFDGVMGMYYTRARLQALTEIAIERGIFPEEYLVARPGENPEILQLADGKNGQLGVVKGGDIQQLQLNPGYKTDTALDRLERQERLEGAIPAEFGGECVDLETEILTSQGWKQYNQIDVGTEVLGINHETGLAQWTSVEAVNVFPNPGHVLVADGPRHSSVTTLNHRWSARSGVSNEQEWVTSADLTSTHRIPIAAYLLDAPREAKWSDALVEAVAWFYTEGSHRESGGQISQSIKKFDNVERIRACLTGMFGQATYDWRNLSGAGQGGVGHDGVPRWNETKPNEVGVIKFNLSQHATAELLVHAPGKVPSFDWLRTLTTAQAELFVKISLLADNCGESRLGQKDKARTEAFAFAAILAGNAVSYQTRVHSDDRPEWPEESTSYIARVRKRRWVNPKENAQRGNSVFEVQEYHGDVWCPTTGTGTWLARRKGSVYFTGNSGTNIRTGRRGDSILSATVDYRVQEAQSTFEASLFEEDKIAIAIEKAYWGDVTKTFFIPSRSSVGQETYIPSKIWQTDFHYVAYSAAGSDVNSLIIGLGQRLGTGLMSKESAREADPLITDPELEHDRLVAEGVESALLSSIQQQAVNPQGPYQPDDLAYLTGLVLEKDVTLYEAVKRTDQRARDRQAAAMPQGSPETMSGLATPGMGAEAPVQGPQGAPPLDALLAQLGA